MSSDRQDTTGYQFSVGLLSAFIFSYILMITTTYLTIYPQITVNNRMFSPVFTAVIWMVGLLAAYSLRGVKLNRLIQVGIGCVVIILIGWYGIRCVKIVQTNQEVGMGYQEVIWKQSEILQAVKNLPESALIVTNEELLILFWLDRPSYPFAETYFKDPVNKFYRYGDGDLTTDSAQRCFREEGAYFVLFNTIENEFRSMYGDKAEERLAVLTDGLIKIYSGSDGAIYLYP